MASGSPALGAAAMASAARAEVVWLQGQLRGKKGRQERAVANNVRRDHPHNSNGLMFYLKSNVDLRGVCIVMRTVVADGGLGRPLSFRGWDCTRKIPTPKGSDWKPLPPAGWPVELVAGSEMAVKVKMIKNKQPREQQLWLEWREGGTSRRVAGPILSCKFLAMPAHQAAVLPLLWIALTPDMELSHRVADVTQR